MVNIRLMKILLVIAVISSLTSLSFSIWIYTFDFSSKLSAHSSSQAEIGLSVEQSNAYCGDNLCNGAETCSSCSADCGACSSGSSGGSGGGSSYSAANFKVNKDNFNIKIVSGDSQTNEVIVENTGNIPLNIKISAVGIENYIEFSSDSIYISKGGVTSFNFKVNGPEPGVYAGKIILTYQGITKEILVVLNVVSEGVLFDTVVTVPDLYRILRQGQKLPALIELLELGQETGVEVTMTYVIKDFEDHIYYTESETFYVKGAKSYSKRFSTSNLSPGDYILGVELSYIGGFAVSTAHFRISDSIITPQTWVAIGSIILTVLVIILAILFFRNKSKEKLK